MKWLVYGMMWLCTTIAVIAGIVITGYAECLCVLIVPVFATVAQIIGEY